MGSRVYCEHMYPVFLDDEDDPCPECAAEWKAGEPAREHAARVAELERAVIEESIKERTRQKEWSGFRGESSPRLRAVDALLHERARGGTEGK